ncbi:MAG: extracellular solute-binding protein, partial [Actinomycetota bacterium]
MFSTPRARNRRIAVVVVALLGTGLLAGCSGQPTGSTTLDTKAAVTLTVWTGQEAGAEKLLEKLGAKFQKLHPNVTLKLSPGASSTEDLLQKLSASFAGGNYPDMSYSFGSWTSQLESSGRTLDITDKVADPSVKWSEFSKAAQETARPTGKKTIGFPAIVDNLSLLYNKTVFDKAGVAYPTNDWTWDDFRAAAKKLTDPSTNTYGYAYGVSGSEETTWQLWPH